MTMISIIQAASRDAYPALLAGIEQQFGREGSDDIAAQFLDAERADFHWESRIEERHLGRYEGDSEDGDELDRVGIIGQLKGVWYVAICIVDGNGAVHWMDEARSMKGAVEAGSMFCRLH